MPRATKNEKASLWRQLKAKVPRDNPLERHEKLKLDLKSGIEELVKEGVVRAEMAAEGAVVKGKVLSDLRKAALKQARDTSSSKKGTAVAMAPAPGISNWVQLGPLAIPRGQSSSPPYKVRVNVTGRVTSIVVDPTDPDILYLGAAQGGSGRPQTEERTGRLSPTTRSLWPSGLWPWTRPITWCSTQAQARATSRETATTATAS